MIMMIRVKITRNDNVHDKNNKNAAYAYSRIRKASYLPFFLDCPPLKFNHSKPSAASAGKVISGVFRCTPLV